MQRAIAVVVATTLTGCGLTMTTGPDPNRPPAQRPVCTETMDAPKKDGIGAVLGFLGVLTGLLFLEADDDDQIGAPVLIGGLVVMAASYASGGVGYYRVKKCQKAIAEWQHTQPPGAR